MVTIDLDLMERTIRRTQDYYDQHGIAFRPHIKTHKIPAIAHLQVEAGARGITCQKLGEAEVFLAAGLRDILIPYNIVGEAKAGAPLPPGAPGQQRAIEPGQITVSRRLGDHRGGDLPGGQPGGGGDRVEVECDTGMHRAGVQSPQEAADLAAHIARLPGLRFAGWMTYPTGAETVPFFQEATRLTEAGGLTGGGAQRRRDAGHVAGPRGPPGGQRVPRRDLRLLRPQQRGGRGRRPGTSAPCGCT